MACMDSYGYEGESAVKDIYLLNFQTLKLYSQQDHCISHIYRELLCPGRTGWGGAGDYRHPFQYWKMGNGQQMLQWNWKTSIIDLS